MHTTLPDPEQLLATLTTQIQSRITPNTALIGIYTGGVWLMEKILDRLQATVDYPILNGKLDAAMYRDDYAQRGLKAKAYPASLPFDVNGKDIILIDDIFYTGRTTRAVMNELFDHGRPASIRLAVLINRGGAQLPIQPDMVGATLPIAAHQAFELAINTHGTLHLSLTTPAEEASRHV